MSGEDPDSWTWRAMIAATLMVALSVLVGETMIKPNSIVVTGFDVRLEVDVCPVNRKLKIGNWRIKK